MPPKEYLCDCTRFCCVSGRTQPKIVKKATWHKHAPYRKAAEPQITPIGDFLAQRGVPFEAAQPAQPHPRPSRSPSPGPSNKRPRFSRSDAADIPISENTAGDHIDSGSSTNEGQVVESSGGAEEQHSDNGSYLGLFSEELDGDDVGVVVRVRKSVYLFNSANKIIIALNIFSPDQAHPFSECLQDSIAP